MAAGIITEVAVIGAGPAGLTAALALSALGIEVVIAAPPYDPTRAEADRRTTALLPGSIELLKNLGVWENCADHSAALEGVRIVDDRGGLMRAPELLFKAQELGLPSFGANVANTVLNAALHGKACANDGPRWLPKSVVKVEPGRELVAIEFDGGGAISASLLIAADGRASIARTAAGIGTRSWSYGQTAIAATFRHSRPHAGVTTELHRRAGPLTTVPLPGDASSLVWVEEPALAAHLAALDDVAFLAELTARLQGLLGSLSHVGPRGVHSLSGLSALHMGQNRIALVGESAHVIPPIGAQGLNLGLRDVAVLAESVGAARERQEDIGGAAMLEAYHAKRATDVLGRTISVDLLNRSLLSDFLPVQGLRGLGLHLLANVGPLRRLVMQAGLGIPGSVPRLMQPGGFAR